MKINIECQAAGQENLRLAFSCRRELDETKGWETNAELGFLLLDAARLF